VSLTDRKKVPLTDVLSQNGVSLSTYYARLNRGWDQERAATTPVVRGLRATIVIDGKTEYLADVRARTGISDEVFRSRLKKGWDRVRAATTPLQAPGRRPLLSIEIDGERQVLADVLKARGIPRSCYSHRVAHGGAPSTAATTPVMKRGGQLRATVQVDGKPVLLADALARHGVTRGAFERRVAMGWDRTRAATTPLRTSRAGAASSNADPRKTDEYHEYLVSEHDAATRAAQQAQVERDAAVARATALERELGRAARLPSAAPPNHEIVRALVSGTLSVEQALRVTQEQHPSRVVVLESAWRSARRSAEFRYGTRALELLLDLVTRYVDRLTAGGGDTEARKVFGSAYAATEASGATNARARALRTFSYTGQDVLMLRHLKIGTKDSVHETWRCHFMWDAAAGKIVIGHCGPHLDLR
jgi:hypothetical protein